ncbi:response regulator transcription factor [Pusillimonas sp. MFBS29]|uniref:helix-turn-helix transcriptional regulator n=1 Tax=Pusillimonas sp. MFBS29 TaxID=2886690 RepID=UPI001D100A62|nr:response regulator transcription factor [Pusillimonas sp. MFBS29]MCC2595665.1 response regulator transcription factor [Pusillimonas sp. MFBS29]
MTTLIIIEPHPLQQLGLQRILAEITTPACIIHVEDYSTLDKDTPGEKCDLALLSISSFNDIQRLAAATERVHSPKAILLLAESDEMPHRLHGLPASVAGYIPKHTCPATLQASVLLVLAGGRCFPLSSTAEASGQKDLLPRLKPSKWPATDGAPSARPDDRVVRIECELLGLTPRQYEVLVLLARGFRMKEVGRHLNISVATAKAHTETLYQRLDVHNRNAAVYEAFARGASLGWTTASPSAGERAR